LSLAPKFSVSTVRFFLTAGVDDFVPVLFSEDFCFVTWFTLPFNASFYFARAYSFAYFSSSALH
jgi:hypothetical protein